MILDTLRANDNVFLEKTQASLIHHQMRAGSSKLIKQKGFYLMQSTSFVGNSRLPLNTTLVKRCWLSLLT